MLGAQLWPLSCPSCDAEAKSFYSGCKACGYPLKHPNHCVVCWNLKNSPSAHCTECNPSLPVQTPKYTAEPSHKIRSVSVVDGYFILRFPYEHKLVSEVRRIPDARWSPNDRVWYFPAANTASIRRFIEIAWIYPFVPIDNDNKVKVRKLSRAAKIE